MGSIEKSLEPVTGYLYQIFRNVETEKYEIIGGIPPTWVFKSTNKIICEELNKTENGLLIRIYSNDKNVDLDDLIEFFIKIIKINENIAEKEKIFATELEKMKNEIENRIKNFYEELNKLKENSFKSDGIVNDNINSENENKENTNVDDAGKQRQSRKSKINTQDSDKEKNE